MYLIFLMKILLIVVCNGREENILNKIVERMNNY